MCSGGSISSVTFIFSGAIGKSLSLSQFLFFGHSMSTSRKEPYSRSSGVVNVSFIDSSVTSINSNLHMVKNNALHIHINYSYQYN